MALVGLGFNVKMLAAWVVLPTFVLVYFLGAPIAWRCRLADLTLAAVVLVTVSLAWAVIYDLTPPEHRPFAGTTKKNSMLELRWPYAVRRFVPVVKRSELPGRSERSGLLSTELRRLTVRTQRDQNSQRLLRPSFAPRRNRCALPMARW
jgi:4-amino-4-deoxy-L-arabinose transferase-like glycosyltransferase